jgi:hypothetical protein
MPLYPIASSADEAALSCGPFYSSLDEAQRRSGGLRLALVTERASRAFPDREAAESAYRSAIAAGRASLLELTAGWAVHFDFWRALPSSAPTSSPQV